MNKKRVLLAAFLLSSIAMNAQIGDANAGAAGLDVAVDAIAAYFPTVKKLCYAVGGVVALIGGIRIYNKWNAGDQDISKELVSYGGAMLFLVLVPNVVSAFFGVTG